MKIIQTIREEIVPLSRKQGVILLIIIACVFQLVLFYAPALAADSVKQAKAQANDEEMIISNEVMVKDVNMGQVTQRDNATTSPIIIQTENQVASSTPKTPEYKVIRTSTHTMTAYNSEPGQTDDSPCITANGFNVCKHGEEDTIAANFLKFGTKVMIPELFGDRVFVVRDRMNKKHPNRVDVWMKDHSDAMKFGVKVAKIQVIE
jgi:3D (Asp-Asp-Asp) domain-containing protein